MLSRDAGAPAAGAGELAERLERVRATIAAAALRVGRQPEDVTLVAATKTVPAPLVYQAALLGVRHFGENYVQEAAAKRSALQGTLPPGVCWHLIGHLQTNKAAAALELFDIIETADSFRVAQAISRRAGARAVPVLLEVALGEAPERLGFRPDELERAVAAVRELPGVAVQGLMAVPPPEASLHEVRRLFRRLRELRGQLASTYPDQDWRHLSMGMSGDYEVAIEEGATMVRIGRAIFGERPSKQG
ncbi:MAG: YggS family pyridoxal phosphate-dependent enzyme [Chloroflexi bacterium]|nr:YggS family pyridoxal phosphate-dependent enzyme [Chloroflexota bacterium]